MKNTKNTLEFKEPDDVILSLRNAIPDCDIIDANQFLSKNKEAIILELNKSRLNYKRNLKVKICSAVSIFVILTMLFSFSAEAQSYVKNLYYTVVEWFDSGKDKSGVIFNIKDNGENSSAPKKVQDQTEKIEFSTISEAKDKYNTKIFELDGSDIILDNGYIQDNTICLNYKMDETKIQIIEEPMQQKGSVGFNFNDSNYEKYNSNLGTLYYKMDNGKLFGGMIADNTVLIISAQGLAEDKFDFVINSIG